MKNTILIILAATFPVAAQTNLQFVDVTTTHTNPTTSSAMITVSGSFTNASYTVTNPAAITIGDSPYASFTKINNDLIFLENQIQTNNSNVGYLNAAVVNISSDVYSLFTNGSFTWIGTNIIKSIAANTNTVSVLNFSNSVLASQQFTLLNTNPFVFTGSNYLGTFAQLQSYDVNPPCVGGGGLTPCTSLNEWLILSTNGGASWFTNTTGIPNITNTVMVSVVGESNAAPGSVVLYGIDHPELNNRTNSFFGQHYSFDNPLASSDAVTLGYLNKYPVAVVAQTVQLSAAFTMLSTNLLGTNHIIFSGSGATALDLAVSIQFTYIQSIALDASKTNILLGIYQTNLTAGSFIETCTNITPPVVWNLVTNYTTATNTGLITYTIPRNLSVPVQFWRARAGGEASLNAGPVSIGAGGFKQLFYTPTNSSDGTLGNVSGLMRWDTTNLYVGITSNVWRRISIPTNTW